MAGAVSIQTCKRLQESQGRRCREEDASDASDASRGEGSAKHREARARRANHRQGTARDAARLREAGTKPNL